MESGQTYFNKYNYMEKKHVFLSVGIVLTIGSLIYLNQSNKLVNLKIKKAEGKSVTNKNYCVI